MTAITEQTKNASKASRGLNAIMANLAQVLDGASSNGKKITEIFKQLGVEMYENGQLKSGYDLLAGLSEKWDTLDNNSQKYIATTIAGTTQLNNFLALMNNFDHAVGATNTALDSQGSAMRENSAYMESIQAKLSQLQSTFQDFANNVISSDLAKAVLDLANGLLQIANTDLGQIVTQIVLLTGLGWGATSLTKALGIFKVGIEQTFPTSGLVKVWCSRSWRCSGCCWWYHIGGRRFCRFKSCWWCGSAYYSWRSYGIGCRWSFVEGH